MQSDVGEDEGRDGVQADEGEGRGGQELHRTALFEDDSSRTAEARVLVATQQQDAGLGTHRERAEGAQEADLTRVGETAAGVEEEDNHLRL